MTDEGHSDEPELPKHVRGAQPMRAILNAAGGAIPFVGGILAAGAAAWSEEEQAKFNRFFETWLKMLRAQFHEQAQTIAEVGARLDMHDEEIAKRVESAEFQSLVRKAFREWAGVESEQKRVYIRNILSNAAATRIVSDDVVKLFLDWLANFSELHFRVISVIYNRDGITRGEIWREVGSGPVREDSAEADLFKLLVRDLSTGGIIRQHRETDYAGNFLRKPAEKRPSGSHASQTTASAFDDVDGYELTNLGKQFVHYAMTEVTTKLEFRPSSE
jgi:hypothetical protein